MLCLRGVRGSLSARSAAGFDRRDREHEGCEGGAVVGVGRGHPDGQWDARAVAQGVDLGAAFASIDRVRAGQRSPFFARSDAPSSIARDQSIMPLEPSSSSTARCTRRHSPDRVHSVNRRCAVGTFTPKLGGRCRHAQPLVSTNTIAVNTARSSTRGIPPPCRRTGAGGINGSTNAHNSSSTNRAANSSITDQHHARRSTKIQVRHALRTVPATPPLCRRTDASAILCSFLENDGNDQMDIGGGSIGQPSEL